MADKDRYVVVEHYVFDTKLRRYAPFGDPAGAGVVADQFNGDRLEAELFTWIDGDPRKPAVRKQQAQQQTAIEKPS